MARQRQTRRRKRRGTQAGTVRPRGRGGGRGRTRTRADARATAEQRRQEKLRRPPTWQGAITRGAIAAVGLFAILVVALGASPVQAIGLALFASVLYVPAFHLTDTVLFRYRQRKREREAAGLDS